jgi:hypothetical protein
VNNRIEMAMSSLGTLGYVGKRLVLWMQADGLAYCLRRIRPLDATVEAFGVLAEDDRVDPGLIEPAICPLPHEVERVAGKRTTRAHADVQVEQLPHADDRAEVLVTLVLQLGLELLLRLQFGLGGDRAKKSELVLSQKIDRPVGQRVALVDPELPADVRVDVLRIEPHRVQHPQRLGKDGLSDTVPGHDDYRVFCHLSLPHLPDPCYRSAETRPH